MPVKNPSPELLERIRQDGLCKASGVRAQWGYHEKASPRVFLLDKGEELPKDWQDTPFACNPPPAPAEQ